MLQRVLKEVQLREQRSNIAKKPTHQLDRGAALFEKENLLQLLKQLQKHLPLLQKPIDPHLPP